MIPNFFCLSRNPRIIFLCSRWNPGSNTWDHSSKIPFLRRESLPRVFTSKRKRSSALRNENSGIGTAFLCRTHYGHKCISKCESEWSPHSAPIKHQSPLGHINPTWEGGCPQRLYPTWTGVGDPIESRAGVRGVSGATRVGHAAADATARARSTVPLETFVYTGDPIYPHNGTN